MVFTTAIFTKLTTAQGNYVEILNSTQSGQEIWKVMEKIIYIPM